MTRPAPSRTASEHSGAPVGAPYVEPSSFRAGQVLLRRFRVLRFIARGGAGEVYEAFDQELRCPIGLKVVRPELAETPRALERFRREIALARQVTHPNVCRIFDVYRVEVPSPRRAGDTVKTFFLTMELLVGESLATRIAHQGPLPRGQALPIVIDIVEGLKAAHRAGVIHRDLKSANIMIARQGDTSRAVIMDFGLAREKEPDGETPLTYTGTVVGTPTYMAPEQLTGKEITAATDQYALGIVIFEMVTGTRPFVGENDLSTAIKRLTEAPRTPSSLLPGFDPRWERAILRCLAVKPGDRFPDLDSLLAEFLAAGSTAPIPVSRPSRPSVVRPGLLVAAGLLLLAGALSSWLIPTLAGAAAPLPAQAEALAGQGGVVSGIVATLRNRTGDPTLQLAAGAISALLTERLLETTPVSRVVRRGPDASFDTPFSRAGAQLLVSGELRNEGNGPEIMLEVGDDRGTRAIAVPLNPADLVGSTDQALAALGGALGLEDPLGRSATASGMSLYRAARREADAYRLSSAITLLHAAARTATNPRPWAELAFLEDWLGNKEEATTALRRAQMPGDDRESEIEVRAASAWVSRNYSEAAELYGALANFLPDSPIYIVRSAEAARRAGDLPRAERLLHSAEQTGDVKADPWWLLVSARTAAQSGRSDRSAEATSRLRELGEFEQNAALVAAAAELSIP